MRRRVRATLCTINGMSRIDVRARTDYPARPALTHGPTTKGVSRSKGALLAVALVACEVKARARSLSLIREEHAKTE